MSTRPFFIHRMAHLCGVGPFPSHSAGRRFPSAASHSTSSSSVKQRLLFIFILPHFLFAFRFVPCFYLTSALWSCGGRRPLCVLLFAYIRLCIYAIDFEIHLFYNSSIQGFPSYFVGFVFPLLSSYRSAIALHQHACWLPLFLQG